MRTFCKPWVLAAILITALASVLTPHAAAQNDGAIRGQIMDVAGKPWAILRSSRERAGHQAGTKTDKDGNYAIRNLRSGVYVIHVLLPSQSQPYQEKVQVQGGNEAKKDFNFKELAASRAQSIKK